MIRAIKKIIPCCMLPLFLFSCSKTSIPVKGYQMYKEQNTAYLISIGGTGDEITYKNCSYVWIKGDGTLEAGTLVNTVWYMVSYTLTFGSRSVNARASFEYSNTANYVQELEDGTAYQYAFSLVLDGSLSGERGNL